MNVMTICNIFTLKFLNDSPVPEYKKGVQMNAFLTTALAAIRLYRNPSAALKTSHTPSA